MEGKIIGLECIDSREVALRAFFGMIVSSISGNVVWGKVHFYEMDEFPFGKGHLSSGTAVSLF